jgi:hypothetical protein
LQGVFKFVQTCDAETTEAIKEEVKRNVPNIG